MSNTIPRWLSDHYRRAKANGWIPYFRDSAGKHGFTTEDVMAIASRESNMKNIKGDFRNGIWNGFSLMQLDINSHKRWIQSGAWQNVNEAIEKGCQALAEKRDQIIAASKQKKAYIKFRSGKTVAFTPKPFNDAQLRQMTIAAYNSGMAAYYHFSIGNSIDAGTTGKNYSRDVLERSIDFKELLGRDATGEMDKVVSPLTTPEPKPNLLVANPEEPDPNDPVEQNSNDFETVQKVYNNHAELLQNPSTKSVAAKAGGGLLTGLAAIWSNTFGKVALVLTGLLILSVAGYTVYKYRVRIGLFFKGAKAWIFRT